MQLTKRSPISGTVTTLNLPISNEQMDAYIHGMPVQEAFPNLPPELQAFIDKGITPDEFKEFGHVKKRLCDNVDPASGNRCTEFATLKLVVSGDKPDFCGESFHCKTHAEQTRLLCIDENLEVVTHHLE